MALQASRDVLAASPGLVFDTAMRLADAAQCSIDGLTPADKPALLDVCRLATDTRLTEVRVRCGHVAPRGTDNKVQAIEKLMTWAASSTTAQAALALVLDAYGKQVWGPRHAHPRVVRIDACAPSPGLARTASRRLLRTASDSGT